MNVTIDQPALQKKTLRLYGELLCRRESWAGALVLAAFAGASGSGFAAAASLAGAASITVDVDAAAMKAHFRDGAFDFLVNTLDEALRTIKNQVRVGRPIAIGLIAEPTDALSEAGERGVAATLVLSEGAMPSESERAVMEVSGTHVDASAGESSELRIWLEQRGWRAVEAVPGVKEVGDDAIRQRWWKDFPTHQRSARGGSRWIWVGEGEDGNAV